MDTRDCDFITLLVCIKRPFKIIRVFMKHRIFLQTLINKVETRIALMSSTSNNNFIVSLRL